MSNIRLRCAVSIAVLTIAGCGGGSGAGGNSNTQVNSPPLVTNASPGGIWRGASSASGLQVIGLIDEAGEFHFIQSDNVQYVGTAITSGSSVSANFEGFTQVGTAFPDQTTHGTGTVSGSIQQRSSLTLNTQFKTDGGTASTGTLNLTFDSLYNRTSSLATIGGNYSSNGETVTVDSNGNVFAQDPTSSCVTNGTVSIINATYNAYKVQFSYANCTGQYSVLNGLQFSGMAILDNTQSPEHAIV